MAVLRKVRNIRIAAPVVLVQVAHPAVHIEHPRTHIGIYSNVFKTIVVRHRADITACRAKSPYNPVARVPRAADPPQRKTVFRIRRQPCNRIGCIGDNRRDAVRRHLPCALRPSRRPADGRRRLLRIHRRYRRRRARQVVRVHKPIVATPVRPRVRSYHPRFATREMRRRMARRNCPSVARIHAQSALPLLCRPRRRHPRRVRVHNVNVAVPVQVYLPFVQLIACGVIVCSHAELHHQHRVRVRFHKQLLHVVAPAHAVAVASKTVNLRTVHRCIRRAERHIVAARLRHRAPQPQVPVRVHRELRVGLSSKRERKSYFFHPRSVTVSVCRGKNLGGR